MTTVTIDNGQDEPVPAHATGAVVGQVTAAYVTGATGATVAEADAIYVTGATGAATKIFG